MCAILAHKAGTMVEGRGGEGENGTKTFSLISKLRPPEFMKVQCVVDCFVAVQCSVLSTPGIVCKPFVKEKG